MTRKMIFLLFIFFASTSNPLYADKPFKVFISQVVQHPALNRTREGLIDALKEAGFKQGYNLEVRSESAQANPTLAQQIASNFISREPDIVVGIGTISAQSLLNAAIKQKVKLIFSSVTDPLNAGLVKELKHPGNNTSGVSNFVELRPQLEMFKRILPQLKTVGILYNPGETNSVSVVNQLAEICPLLGITLVKQTIDKTANAAQSTAKLAASCDAIFISNDNTALAALTSILKVAGTSKTPVFVSDTDAVELGALAALGPNQYNIGQQTGRMIVRLLQGHDISTQPVEFPEQTELYINAAAAAKADIEISRDILQMATKIIRSME